MKLNGQTVTFAGAGANATISEIVSSINGSFASHSVTASTLTTSTTVTSDTSAVAYGLVGGYVPFSAYIDSGSGNTLINFSTSTAGQATYGIAVGIAEDMAADINSGSITNLNATFTGSNELVLTEANGNAITITNNTNDTNNKPFVGTSLSLIHI